MADGDDRTFELGLIMAGAISAGAYTAGVIDFLIEALDAWEAAKREPGYDGPAHRVVLKVMTGASAGAMTSAIAAVSLHAETEPVHDVDNPPPADRNRLYDAWVRRVDIANMLGDEDIRRDRRLLSALDSSDLDRIATGALSAPRRARARDWVADPLAVFLTVANLRGVPYAFNLFGSNGATQYGMTAHKDHMRFSVSPARTPLPGARLLDPAEAPAADWPWLARTALASGAFPIGLRSRVLERPWADYKDRPPRSPLGTDAPETYRFLCVDGGLIDNEPLELARHYLADGGQNPRTGTEAHRAVVMVDPFPNVATLAEDNGDRDGLVAVSMAMFGALINQARFKPDELALAEDDGNYSRFMISPARSDAAGARIEPAMASATLGGFGGFLAEDFRKHDFQLGRRNCQRFLARHFTLPESNPLFEGWTGATRDASYMRYADGTLEPYTDSDPTPMLPIVPLVGALRDEVPLYKPPRAASVDLDALEKRIAARAKSVGEALIDGDLRDLIGNGTIRWTARRFLGWRIVPRIAARLRAKIAAELAVLR